MWMTDFLMHKDYYRLLAELWHTYTAPLWFLGMFPARNGLAQAGLEAQPHASRIWHQKSKSVNFSVL